MRLIKKADNWYNLYDGDVGIGSTHPDLQGYRLSLDNCLDIDSSYDLDELARQSRDKVSMLFKDGLHEKSHTVGFRAGWQQAINFFGHNINRTEWDVAIKMHKYLDGYEMVGYVKGVYGSGNRIPIYKSEPKLDEDGCIILKRIT